MPLPSMIYGPWCALLNILEIYARAEDGPMPHTYRDPVTERVWYPGNPKSEVIEFGPIAVSLFDWWHKEYGLVSQKKIDAWKELGMPIRGERLRQLDLDNEDDMDELIRETHRALGTKSTTTDSSEVVRGVA